MSESEEAIEAPTAPGVIFTNWDDFHGHHKSEWHRYNLKRRIAQLPCITKEVFEEKAAAQRALASKAAAKPVAGTDGGKRWYCEVSNKYFKTKNQYDNFRQSKQFKKREEEYNAKQQRRREAKMQSDADSVQEEDEQSKGGQSADVEMTPTSPHPSPSTTDPGSGSGSGSGDSSKEGGDGVDVAPFVSDYKTRLIRDMRDIYGPTFLLGHADAAALDDEEASGSEDFRTAADITPEEYEVAEDSIKGVLARVVKWNPTWDLFSNKRFATIEECLEHMGRTYSFFIPDREFCIDEPGLLTYLGEKISAGFSLYTSKLTKSGAAARDQMVSKGQTKVNWDGDAPIEFEKYYDYSSSYPDNGAITDVNEDGTLALPSQYQNTSRTMTDDNSFELALPGGRRAGHRTLQRYYKQHFQPQSDRKSLAINRSVAQYDDMQLGTYKLSREERRADKAKKVWERHSNKIRLKDGVQNNKQKHFRRQYLNAG